MAQIKDEYTRRYFKNLIWYALITHAIFLIYLPLSAGGLQSMLSSTIRLVSFVVVFLTGLFTVGLIIKINSEPDLLHRIAARMQTIALLRLSIWLLGLPILAGISFLLLPAYEAYQVFVVIPRLYPLIAPLVGWFVAQAVLLHIYNVAIQVGNHNNNAPMIAELTKSLLISVGVLLAYLYLSSIFIAWFAHRGVRLF